MIIIRKLGKVRYSLLQIQADNDLSRTEIIIEVLCDITPQFNDRPRT